MHDDAKLSDEAGRIAALQRLAVLDTAPEEPFDNVVALVRAVLSVPMAAVSLLDEDRQWFKARSGIDVAETPRNISFCTHAIEARTPFVVSDATRDDRFAGNPLVLGDPSIRSYAGIPLQTGDGYNVGTLCAIDTKPREYTSGELEILAKFARIVVDELELRRIAGRDQLTGALTRRGFIDRVQQEIERFRRYGRPASLMMVDIDHFKAINDTYGHPTGDAVLRDISGLLHAAKRPSDVLGRLGGEEFALLMPETDANAALVAGERFRDAIAGEHLHPTPALTLRLTASFGIAQIDATVADPDSWIALADKPLYAAKRAGRNRCVLAGEEASSDI